jgi:hypothetical protein
LLFIAEIFALDDDNDGGGESTPVQLLGIWMYLIEDVILPAAFEIRVNMLPYSNNEFVVPIDVCFCHTSGSELRIDLETR